MPRPIKNKRSGKPPVRRPKGGGRATPKRRPRPATLRPPQAGADDDRGERLQKVLAAAGIASRRECEALIVDGRVQVDGEIVSELGARVNRTRQEIRVDGEPLARPKLQYYAVNKPTGVVCTARDPAGRPRVTDLLPTGVGRMFNVGRLDLASEGLILVTNDGELANQLTHPRHGVEKTYEVQVAGQLEPDVLAQLQRGVHLAEGFVHAVKVRVKSRKKNSTLLEVVLDEGRNREIRRLLARVGHKVQRLTRIAVGPIRLGEMPRGSVRPLKREEIQKLREVAAQGRTAEAEQRSKPAARPAAVARRVRKHGAAAGKAGAPRAAKQRPKKTEEAVPERRVIGDESAAAPKRPSQPKPRGGKTVKAPRRHKRSRPR